MLKLNLPTVDLESSENGKWFDFNDTISFRIARDGNKNHKRALQSRFKQIAKMREKNDFQRIERLTNEMMAKHILKDWKGVMEATAGGEEKALEFNESNALSIISDPMYQIIKEFITDCSQEGSEFETGEDEIVKK
jgi:hypothetical protein